MFLVETITTITKAMKDTFDVNYPHADFRDLHVSVEYPDERVNYPGIWTDFDVSSTLRTVGIGHTEWVDGVTVGTQREVRRWRFAGRALYTVAALTNLERARLVDEVIRVLAFGRAEQGRNTFRDVIEDNVYIALSAKFDEIAITGMSNAPGTPWGTADMIYEATLALDVIGEFVSDPVDTTELVPLSAVVLTEYLDEAPEQEEPWL